MGKYQQRKQEKSASFLNSIISEYLICLYILYGDKVNVHTDLLNFSETYNMKHETWGDKMQFSLITKQIFNYKNVFVARNIEPVPGLVLVDDRYGTLLYHMGPVPGP